MAIYQPINAWPTTRAIDITRDNTFSVEMNTSGSIIAYNLTILDWDNNVVLEEPKVVLEEPLYNGDMLYFNPVLKDKLKNGNDYKWRLRLYQDDISIIITSGYITSVNGKNITMPLNSNIKVGMYLKVGDEKHQITAIDRSAQTVTQGTITKIDGRNISVPKNTNIRSGMYFNIGDEQRQIYSVSTEDTTVVTLSSAFPDTITGGNYVVTLEGSQIVTLDAAFSTNISGAFYNIVSDFLDTTPDFTLYARSTPTVAFTNFKSEVNDRHYIFTGIYEQAEFVPMTYYQISLMLVQNNVSREIYNTGKVYRADIKLDYDGYLTGNQYQIELQVANESGVTTTTGIKTFTAKYDTVEFLTEPQLYLDCKKHAIRINWTTPIDFEPSTYNVGAAYNGVVKGALGNTMQIEKGLDIKSGAIVIFGSKYENQVSVYDAETGLLALRYAMEDEIIDGTKYVILNYVANDGMLELLLNDPYRMTNSVNTLENVLRFESERVGYIGKTPENDNITFQFKLPDAFWDGVLTQNMRLLPMLRIQTEDDNMRGFEVFVNLNKLVFIRPTLSNNMIYKIPIKEVKNRRSFVLEEPIDFGTQRYLRLDGYDDILEIMSYDEATQTVILVDDAPFRLDVGSNFIMYDTLSYDFYTLLRYFPLQEQGTWNGTYDYIWDDVEEWNDELYWFEGGGARQRIANTWFKARINGNEMDVRAGGV